MSDMALSLTGRAAVAAGRGTRPRRSRPRRSRSARGRCGARRRRPCGRGRAPTRCRSERSAARARSSPGRCTCATRDRIVDRRAVPAVDRAMEAAVELEQLRHDRRRCGRPRRSCSACAGVTSAPVRDVEADHRHVEPAREDARAASGSAQMLNSAAGVTLPSAIAPPISTIRSGLASGCGPAAARRS